MNRFRLVRSIWKNNRLSKYEAILRKANDSGYKITGIAEVRQIMNDSPLEEKLFVLRHDIDRCSCATEKMAKIEKKFGARASYYFRWKTFDIDLIKRLIGDEHECSLHYEIISQYYIANKINPFTKRVNEEIINICCKILKQEINEFENLCSDHNINISLKTVAAHGHRINKILGFPGNRLFEVAPDDFFCNVKEAYDPAFIEFFDIYISDCSLRKCDGFRYGIHPLEAIDEGYKVIHLLTHPGHWYYSGWQILKESLRALLQGIDRKPDTFKY